MRENEARKRARNGLLLRNAELELQLSEAIRARDYALAQLAQSEKLAVVGELAAGVAHDFNNILQAIALSAEALKKRPNDARVVGHAITLQSQAAERGAAIVRRILAFARRTTPCAAPVKVGAVLIDLVEMLAAVLGAAITIDIHCESDLPLACVDRAQLEAVLVNLAVNSRDAMPGGGVLTLSTRRERVTQTQFGLSPGDYVLAEVADTGAGMDAATLSQACDSFFTTKTDGKGTGLGLSMARRFAEASGGALTISSAPGIGTKVTLWLPQAGCQKEGIPKTFRDASPPPMARILLVEDDPLCGEFLALCLSDHGLDVTMASDGATALASLAAGENFDLLVTDLSMPDVNGLEIVQAARQRRPGLGAIILSGRMDNDDARELIREIGGEALFLRKPVTADELIAAIRKSCCNRKAD